MLQSDFLGPEDLALCQRVFEQVCSDDKMDPGCIDSEDLAAAVLTTFQRGVTNEAELLAAVRTLRNGLIRRAG
jgi:hypothetical protein